MTTTTDTTIAGLLAEHERNTEESRRLAAIEEENKNIKLRDVAAEMLKLAIKDGPLSASEIGALMGAFKVYESNRDYVTRTVILSAVIPGLSIELERYANYPKLVYEFQEAWLGKAGDGERGRALEVIAYAVGMAAERKAIEARQAERETPRLPEETAAMVEEPKAIKEWAVSELLSGLERAFAAMDDRISALEASARDRENVEMYGGSL